MLLHRVDTDDAVGSVRELCAAGGSGAVALVVVVALVTGSGGGSDDSGVGGDTRLHAVRTRAGVHGGTRTGGVDLVRSDHKSGRHRISRRHNIVTIQTRVHILQGIGAVLQRAVATDANNALVHAVAEVVVAGVKIGEQTGSEHGHHTTIKIRRWLGIQFRTVQGVVVGLIRVSDGVQLGNGQTVGVLSQEQRHAIRLLIQKRKALQLSNTVGALSCISTSTRTHHGQMSGLQRHLLVVVNGVVIRVVASVVGRSVLVQERGQHEVVSISARVLIGVRVRVEGVRIRRASGAVIAATTRVVVGTSPLEVNHVVHVQRQLVRDEVILNTGIHLHNITTLATHVQVVDLVARGEGVGNHGVIHQRCVQHRVRLNTRGGGSCGDGWSRLDGEHITAILERASELVGVHFQFHEFNSIGGCVAGTDDDVRVLLQRREAGLSIRTRVVEVRHHGRHTCIHSLRRPALEIRRRDIVAQTQRACLVRERHTRGEVVGGSGGGDMRNLPDESVGKNTLGVGGMHVILGLVQRSISRYYQVLAGIAELVHTGVLRLRAHEGVVAVEDEVVRMAHHIPGEVMRLACVLVIVPLVGGPGGAVQLGIHGLGRVIHVAVSLLVVVHGVGLVVRAPSGAASGRAVARDIRRGVTEHSDIDPRGGRPPGVVVALFRALEPTAVTVGVLTGAAAVVSVYLLVRRVQALVALGLLAQGVVVVVLVHAESARGGCVRSGSLVALCDGVGRGVVLIDRHTITRRRNIRTGAVMLLTEIGNTVLASGPREKVINPA